ncbi:L-amino acid N-acyltransferase YncA/precorrin-6B methylase 2 [Nonomuraea thailandensis]|uniref:Arsenite methyltransferase n=1 Tax=Nonomuraea thailandensis TaxID=1188745 RepID=A0A9X2H073_9ACTN|nr:GNAT family N-acetyltransferase [Nonomuraea thailandensis]MCP2364173.1 L-amino acid N-acyltransferase YncA/precorrin-6B methylase 2 [Nonomuraea thailandensis]
MAHDEIVDHYSALARSALSGQRIADCDPVAFTDGGFGPASYDDTAALPDGALRASLGCGNPVAVAELRTGETVLDLGSGGGIDVLLSARRVGPHGAVFGLDASPAMVELARRNAEQAGVHNVQFLHGTIEAVPLPGHTVDVVISNCVINLSDDKAAVLAEAFRVLRPGGRFGVSDVVTAQVLDEQGRQRAEQRIGCAAGSLSVQEYRDLLVAAGFVQIVITLTADHGDGVHSAIVQAVKPAIGPGLEIRPMREGDAAEVLAIYQAGLDTGQASFETTAPSWEGFTASRLPHLRYVAVDADSGEVLGWVAASAVSSRPVYAGVVEHSIYVHPGCQAHGIGRALLAAFIAATEDAGVWTIQSGVFPENAASLSLHQALGFRVVGTRERIGCHHGLWRDVLMIERRSTLTGA